MTKATWLLYANQSFGIQWRGSRCADHLGETRVSQVVLQAWKALQGARNLTVFVLSKPALSAHKKRLQHMNQQWSWEAHLKSQREFVKVIVISVVCLFSCAGYCAEPFSAIISFSPHKHPNQLEPLAQDHIIESVLGCVFRWFDPKIQAVYLYRISPLHANLQVVNFLGCEHVFASPVL